MCSNGPYVGLKFKAFIPKSLGVPALMSFLLGPFSSFISFSSAFDHGVNGSICLKQHNASLRFHWTHQGPFLWHSHILLQVAIPLKEKGQCLMGFNFQLHWEWEWPAKISGKNLAQLLPLIDNVVANNVTLYMLCSNLLYHNWWSFVLNCLDKDGCSTVWAPCCVVQWIMLSASLGDKPHFLARTKWSSPDTNLCYLQWQGAVTTFQHSGIVAIAHHVCGINSIQCDRADI